MFSIKNNTAETKKIPNTIPVLLTIDGSVDIGSDTRMHVSDDYKLSFSFTGKINNVTFTLEPITLQKEQTLMEKTMDSKNKAQ